MSSTLASYFVQFLRDAEALESSLAEPVLLLEPLDADQSKSSDTDNPYRYKTVSGIGSAVLANKEPLVFVVKKAKDNAFQRGITVGRTANNDLVLDDPSVSRFHAWFQRDAASGAWLLVDAGSKNGTWIGEDRLSSKRATPLVAEARIRFGQVPLTFLTPTDFVRLLRLRAQG